MASDKIIILNFHGLGPLPPGLSPGEQACWLPASFFGEILDFVHGRANVQITLDDANVSDYTIAFPALQSRGMTARFFVVAARVGQSGYLTRGQMRELIAAKMGVGSHGLHHRPWSGLAGNDLEEETAGAKRLLEGLAGETIGEAACPFGSYNRRVLHVLRAAGFDRIYTSDGAAADPTAVVQPRYTIRRDHTLADVKSLVTGTPPLWRRAVTPLKLAVKRWR
jgi:peptidoglycan/xylan/chitin deacetylase (PgdA/CDA1 family)